MIETAVANIVRSTVATDNPLAALYKIVVESLQLLTYRATLLSTSGNQRLQLCSCFLRAISIVLGSNPLVSCSNKLGRYMLISLCCLLYTSDAADE